MCRIRCDEPSAEPSVEQPSTSNFNENTASHHSDTDNGKCLIPSVFIYVCLSVLVNLTFGIVLGLLFFLSTPSLLLKIADLKAAIFNKYSSTNRDVRVQMVNY